MRIANWIENYRDNLKYKISPTSIDELPDWIYDKELGIVRRIDNAFFSIKTIKPNRLNSELFELPLIDQPEIGILGFLITVDQQELKILLQAKSEPGNMFITQIGPSVQATVSNYKSKHHGKSQNYINFFLDPNYPKHTNLKQSEQGNRFLNKYNANIIVQVEKSQIDIEEDKYRWFSLHEVIDVINTNYLFNTDSKSVFTYLLEAIILNSLLSKKNKSFLNSYFNNINSDISIIIEQINRNREENKFNISIGSLNELNKWEINKHGIFPKDKHSFGFQFFDIELEDREVPHWSQPLITKNSIETIVLFSFEKGEEIHFIFKKRLELGFKNYLQLAPTIQSDYLGKKNKLKYKGRSIIQFSQSEEGGRFFNNISAYKVFIIDSIEDFNNSDSYQILNLYQICQLLKIEGIFTNESRTIISSLVSLI